MNKTITIAMAKTIAQQTDAQAVVILAAQRDGTVKVVSYGETREKCRSIGEWAKGLWHDAITIVPFRTMFGWGHGGTPTRLTESEVGQQAPHIREYIVRNTAKAAKDDK